VRPLPSQGSGDLMTLARANAFLVVPPGVTELAGGSLVSVLPK
jgi:molybdopterin biosynthesis enzyme